MIRFPQGFFCQSHFWYMSCHFCCCPESSVNLPPLFAPPIKYVIIKPDLSILVNHLFGLDRTGLLHHSFLYIPLWLLFGKQHGNIDSYSTSSTKVASSFSENTANCSCISIYCIPYLNSWLFLPNVPLCTCPYWITFWFFQWSTSVFFRHFHFAVILKFNEYIFCFVYNLE